MGVAEVVEEVSKEGEEKKTPVVEVVDGVSKEGEEKTAVVDGEEKSKPAEEGNDDMDIDESAGDGGESNITIVQPAPPPEEEEEEAVEEEEEEKAEPEEEVEADEPAPSGGAIPEIEEEDPLAETKISTLTVKVLRKECGDRGLYAKGLKRELVARLEKYLSEKRARIDAQKAKVKKETAPAAAGGFPGDEDGDD